MAQRLGVVTDTVLAFVGRGHNHGNGLTFHPAQAGLAKHQRHIEVEMIAQRGRIQAVDLENIGNLAALSNQLGVHLGQLAVSFANLDFLDPGHARTLPRISSRE